MKLNKLKIGSLFSGAGAFEYAASFSNDVETIFACDNGEVELDINYPEMLEKVKELKTPNDKRVFVDKYYESNTRKRNSMKEFYLHNHTVTDEMFFNDIKLFDGTDFREKIDILVGGSPCQSFSTVGKQMGFEDTRGTLFYEYARILKETNPEMFVYENVKGLTTHDKGKTFSVIQATFKELGYYFKFAILNSRDYGLPQNRNRIFVVGFKSEKDMNEFTFEEKSELKFVMHDFLESNVKKGSFLYENDNIKIIKRNRKSKVGDRYYLTPGVLKYVMSSGTKTWRQDPKIDLKVARPVLKTMGNHHRAGTDNYVKEFGEIRMLTEREAFRLQGFSDDVDINVSPARAYRLAGNSIPVKVLIPIFKSLSKIKNK